MSFAQSQNNNAGGAGASHENGSSSTSMPQAEKILIVCGVDGTVYSLEAENGQLVGMFQSGGALVSSSSVSHATTPDEHSSENENDPFNAANVNLNDEDYDESSSDESDADEQGERYHHRANSIPKRRVVPGLDGVLYTLIADTGGDTSSNNNNDGEQQNDNQNNKNNALKLAPLPVSVFDAVESPITTCNDNDDYDEHADTIIPCGMVMGEKHTQIFALDPSTGTVQWMQHGGNARMGFTSTASTTPSSLLHNSERRRNRRRGRNNNDNNNNVLMLQRENYVVREIDLKTGEENWNVTVGKFHALDFGQSEEKEEAQEDMSVTAVTGAGGIQLPVNSKLSPSWIASKQHHHHRRRGKHQFGPDYGENFVEEDEEENFPSIVFGEVSTGETTTPQQTASSDAIYGTSNSNR